MKPARSGVREKIRRVATDLFYKEGYSETGVARLTQAAGTNKTTFYYHYPAKDDLGREYLESVFALLFRRYDFFLKHAATPADFLRRWSRALRKDFNQRPPMLGCPLVGFSHQINLDGELGVLFRERVAEWHGRLADVLKSFQSGGTLDSRHDPRELAGEIIAVYEGNIWLHKMGDPRALDRLDRQWLALV